MLQGDLFSGKKSSPLRDRTTLSNRGKCQNGKYFGWELGQCHRVCLSQVRLPLRMVKDLPVRCRYPMNSRQIRCGDEPFYLEEVCEG